MSSFFTDDTSADAMPASAAEGETSVPDTAASGGGFKGSTGRTVNLVVVDPDDVARNRLVELLGNDVSSFALVEDLVPYLNGESIVMVLGPSCAVDGTLNSVERVIQAHREIGAILVAEELTTSLLQQALRSGVKDVLASPADAQQLQEAIGRVTSNIASSPSVPAEGDDMFDDDGELGQVITVFSTKGGAGKSMIATNLGVTLAQRSDKPVCLVDADLQFGDIAVMLKLSPQHTIVDAVSSLDRLDASLLQNLLITHESSGLLILPAPLEPAFADQIGATEMMQIVEVLRRFCSHVIIDTPAYFNDVVLGMIEISDEVLLIAGMDIPNIKNVKIGLQTLRLLNTPMEKLHLVLNRANSKVKLDVSEVERTLQVSADILIPSDIVVPQSVNRGVPVVQSAPRSGVAKALEEMASMFAPARPSKGRRK
ncbi:MAG: pilus assembly protein CpaE [Candidatus Aldehydirespiratoraceae bacterium]|jgi:pilus assembly protein CpaE